METEWKFLQNQFANTTRSSFKKAIKISNYHDAALKEKSQTQPLLVPIYNRYHPLHLALVNEYTSWKSSGGSQEGQTMNVEQQLELAYGRMNNWDIRIQATNATFEKGTPKYMSIFNDGRKPFVNGGIDERINAYDTLSKNMLPYAEIDAIRAEIEAVYAVLDDARDTQLGAKGAVKTNSGKVEAARVAAMTMQWRNLGFCMDAFWNNTNYIASMFDLTTLREGRQYLFIGTLAPAENKAVLTHTFLADDELRLKNNGITEIYLYLASSPNGTNSDTVKLLPTTEVVIAINQFGDLDLGVHRFLTAINQSLDTAAPFEIEIL